MKNENKLIKKVLTLFLIYNSIIIVLIPEGHGGGILILLEILVIPQLIENGIDVQKFSFLESILGIAIIISLIGKLLLILTLFYKKTHTIKNWIKIGVTLLLVSFLLICFKAWGNGFSLFAITLISGAPFVLYYLRMLFLINKKSNTNH